MKKKTRGKESVINFIMKGLLLPVIGIGIGLGLGYGSKAVYQHVYWDAFTDDAVEIDRECTSMVGSKTIGYRMCDSKNHCVKFYVYCSGGFEP